MYPRGSTQRAIVLLDLPCRSTVSSHGLEPIRQVLKKMAQPTGPAGSGQVAGSPDCGDEGDIGSRISAAVLAAAFDSIDCGSVPRFCYAD